MATAVFIFLVYILLVAWLSVLFCCIIITTATTLSWGQSRLITFFGSVRSSRNANLRSSFCLSFRSSICPSLTCLELSIFIFLSQVSLRSVPGQSQVSLRSQETSIFHFQIMLLKFNQRGEGTSHSRTEKCKA